MFKPGDKVKLVKEEDGQPKPGTMGTVFKCGEDGWEGFKQPFVTVKWDHGPFITYTPKQLAKVATNESN